MCQIWKYNGERAKRWWDFATLGNFKWYLCGIFFLLVASKIIDIWRFYLPPELESIAQYELRNLLLHWNSIWVSSVFWIPIGIAFSAILCLILLTAEFREFEPAYNWEGLLCKEGWLSPLCRSTVSVEGLRHR